MKTIRSILVIGAGLFVSLLLNNVVSAQTTPSPGSDAWLTLIEAVEETTPTPAADVPADGIYYSAKMPDDAPILPGNLGFPAWNLYDNVWLVDDLTSVSIFATKTMTLMSDADTDPGDAGTNSEGGWTNNFVPFPLDTNGLFLEITNYDGNFAYLNLHNGTNQVYAIWDTNVLSSGWQVEMELWPTEDQTNVMPFTVPTLNRQNLFIRAQDWTGVDGDGDGVPDWWSWLYWATNNLPDTNLDYSASGNSFAQDYSNNIVPVVFSFTGMEVTNNYVNSTPVPVQLDVTGNPYYVATLIDDQNFSNAVWNTYGGSSVLVNLGLTEGWHEVWIGLRGHADDPANAIWQWKRLKLDYTPPSLVITGPTNGTVDVPLIQLTGYSPEALSAISYDLTNASGGFSNQPILVTEQLGSTNTWEFTTNYFEGVDVPLTNGINQFTLHATDMAGNTTTTNFSVTVDYSGKTNPPVVQLDWPQDGMVFCGSQIACRGWVSDPTVTISASLVDTNNTTNTFNGLVGRDGNFAIDNLPLSGVTNYLTLTITDVVGNLAVTNLAIVQGDAGLTIDPVAAGQTTVTGSINTTNASIWVNGIPAILNGNTWEADNVPTRPNALVKVTANNQNAVAVVGDIFGVHCTSYLYAESQDYLVDWGTATEHDDSFTFWQNGLGGLAYVDNIYILGLPDVLMWEATSWPAGFWPNPLPPGTYTQYWHGIYPATNAVTSYTVGGGASGEQIGVAAKNTRTGSSFTWNDLTGMTLTPGGSAGSTAKALFEISVSAQTQTNAGPPNPDHVPWYPNDPYVDVAYDQISVGVFGQLDAEGNAYAVLPENKDVDVTPHIKNHDKNLYHLTPGKYKLTHLTECTATGNTNNTRTTIGIGELVDFSGMPDKTAWSVSGGGYMSSPKGSTTTFVASMSPSTSIVTAQVGNAKQSVTFSVIPPSSIIVVSNQDYPSAFGTNNPSGSYMGAETIYTVAIGPTNVSFANVTFGENTNPASLTVTWPNGTNTVQNFRRRPEFSLFCGQYTSQDTVSAPLLPISLLFNGISYADFSYTDSWTDRYLNEAGVWTDFYTMTVVRAYHGSDKKCQINYLGVPGGWQGPF